jgi:hypothetical protein
MFFWATNRDDWALAIASLYVIAPECVSDNRSRSAAWDTITEYELDIADRANDVSDMHNSH